MRSSSNGTSPCKSMVEGEVSGSRPIKCTCNLPIKKTSCLSFYDFNNHTSTKYYVYCKGLFQILTIRGRALWILFSWLIEKIESSLTL